MKNKEQFNLALWDRLKQNNIPHSFETRSEKKVAEVIKFNSDIIYPIIGIMEGSNDVSTWQLNGTYSVGNPQSGNDLMIVWEEEQLMLEGYIDIHKNGNAVFNFNPPTLFTAHISARIKVSIPYTKGEGLGDGK